ncbi:GNAT family N-acetyltransferase [Bifidobacterium platyrrhinorum]|uniref:GNAT family N-acetyltransferase n=1 Tax=Bifidobacterium platyrrhinorum TaxID=2661628 RepID=UPI00298CCE5D|nr:GNAT family N-acetyltransferase [Bifidobacterium platyrrhinorum]
MGFIDVDDAGYIDMLFVDPAYGRMGVATSLLTRVGRFAAAHGIGRLTVHASITARPFFTRRGFRTIETRHPTIGTVSFVNYLMICS